MHICHSCRDVWAEEQAAELFVLDATAHSYCAVVTDTGTAPLQELVLFNLRHQGVTEIRARRKRARGGRTDIPP